MYLLIFCSATHLHQPQCASASYASDSAPEILFVFVVAESTRKLKATDEKSVNDGIWVPTSAQCHSK